MSFRLPCLALFFLCSTQLSKAQDTIFFSTEGYPVFTWLDSETYAVYTEPDTADIILETSYYLDRTLKGQCAYSDYSRNIRHGKCIEYYEGGKAKYQAEFKNGMKHGNIISYYSSGELKRQDFYRNDTLVSGWCYSPSGKRENHYPFEVRPQHSKGKEGFMEELDRLLEISEEGIPVRVEFWVTRDGLIRAAEAQSDDPDAAQPVEKAFLKLNPWRSGMRDGEPDVFREFVTLYLDPKSLPQKNK